MFIANDGKICIKIHPHRKNDIGFKHDNKLKIIEFGNGYDKTKIKYTSLSTNKFITDMDTCKCKMVDYVFETNTYIPKTWFMYGDEYKKFYQFASVLWEKIKYLYFNINNTISHDIYRIIVCDFIHLCKQNIYLYNL
jgi:hypothetical protein